MNTPHVDMIVNTFVRSFPYFAKVIDKRLDDFGATWLMNFEQELSIFFAGDEQSLERAAHGYGVFALDALKLQKRFDKALQYENRSYQDLKGEVYLNRDYMFGLYLPGILISHYLWPHHYRQLLWFRDKFIPLVQGKVANYCDVGVGTGFYSKEMLRALPDVQGHGYDISQFSLEHSRLMIDRWGASERYTYHQQDIIAEPPSLLADSLVNVEVLEHLEDPPCFLAALRRMLRADAFGFVTAAIDAPNKDHIYLYRDLESIASQLRAAGFRVVDQALFPAFEASKPGETVPKNGSFLVQAN